MPAARTLTDTTALLGALGDETRVRLLCLLTAEALTVADLLSVTQIPQSSVSSHLRKLREAGLVRSQPRGKKRLYRAELPPNVEAVWEHLRSPLSDAVIDGDARRLAALLEARQRDEPWPDTIAGEMERHYSPGRTWEASARGLVGLLRLGDVLDIGCGDAHLGALLETQYKSYTGVDSSEKLLAAAQQRLRKHQGVSLVLGDMLALPLDDAAYDVTLMHHVLSYAQSPETALAEATRVTRPGGRIGILTLAAHPHEAVVAPYGHINLGFEPDALRHLLEGLGLQVDLCRITSRERNAPHFQVITAFATKNEPS